MPMIKLAWCAAAALAGGVALCPLCDGILSAGGSAATAAAVSATPAAATSATVFAGVPVADTVKVKLAIEGMTCGGCAMTARIALQRAEGVYRAEVSYDSATAAVWYEPAKTAPAQIIATLRKMTGYEGRVVEEPKARGTP